MFCLPSALEVGGLIDEHFSRALDRGDAFTPDARGLRWADVARSRSRYVRRLRRNFFDHELGAGRRSTLRMDDKERDIYRFDVLDTLWLSALGRGLQASFEAHWPSSLYSYRKGRSSLGAVQHLKEYLRAHRRDCPKNRWGLFVLKCDVSSYSESTPTGPDSLLWPTLEEFFSSAGLDWKSFAPLLRQALNPEVAGAPLGCVPTGSPLAPLANNVYLRSLDLKMAVQFPRELYLRYGDDLLVTSRDASQHALAEALVESECGRLRLKLNPQKKAQYAWSGSGFGAPEGFRAGNTIEYLGRAVRFNGAYSWAARHRNELLSEVSARARAVASQARKGGLGFEERVLVTVQAITRLFTLEDPLGHRSLPRWLSESDDRAQLRSLDQQVLDRVLRELFGSSSRRHLHDPAAAPLTKLPRFEAMLNQFRSGPSGG